MEIPSPLDQMSTEDQLRLMETIWADLTRQDENVPSAYWHSDVLRAREQRLVAGQESFSDWGAAKQQILGSIR